MAPQGHRIVERCMAVNLIVEKVLERAVELSKPQQLKGHISFNRRIILHLDLEKGEEVFKLLQKKLEYLKENYPTFDVAGLAKRTESGQVLQITLPEFTTIRPIMPKLPWQS